MKSIGGGRDVRIFLVPFFLALLVLAGINVFRWFPQWSAEQFEGAEEIATSEAAEKVSSVLRAMLKPILAGAPPYIESTESRRLRYLRKNGGNVDRAVLQLVDKRHSISESTKSWMINAIPFAGLPMRLVRTLWLQLRDTALIAALYGHDVTDDAVMSRVLLSMISADTSKVPKVMSDRVLKYVSQRVARTALRQSIFKYVIGYLPFMPLIDYIFGGQSAVSLQAVENFSPHHDSTFIRQHESWSTWVYNTLFRPVWSAKSVDLSDLREPRQPGLISRAVNYFRSRHSPLEQEEAGHQRVTAR